jgi:hypothetical protein
MKNTIILENEILHIGINGDNGCIENVLLKDINQDVISEKRLAGNFKINLQSDETESNYIDGCCQKLKSYEKGPGFINLFWENPLSNELGEYDIDVSMMIRLVNDEITFEIAAVNRTDSRFSEIWAPVIGGFNGIGKRKDTKAMIPVVGESTGEDMFTQFRCHIELGIPIPEQVYSYPGQMGVQWCDIYNTQINRGLYMACYDKEPRYKSIRFELEPGAAHLREDNWPKADDFDKDLPIGLNTNWVFYPYTKKGEQFNSPPLVIKYHKGNWEAAAGFYGNWFKQNFKIINPNRWQRNEMSFLCTMFMLPESNILFQYKDMNKWIDSAKEYGVNAVLICGWQIGGHDNSYPYYDPDPRLGTMEELRAGIEYAHSVGVKIFFFVNFNQMDTFTPVYKEEFEPYAVSDQWGNVVPYGFGMGTLAARLNYSSRKLVNIDPSYEPMRAYIINKLKWLAEIGADGFHVDKIGFSNVSAIDLNPKINALGYSPDTSIWSGILKFCEELSDVCLKINPDFCFSVEGSWDRFLEYTDVIWMWHNAWAYDHTCAIKHTLAQWTPCYSITQPNDYTSVNEAIRHGYQLFISPMMITASMNHPKFTKLSKYIAEVNKIRDLTKDIIYNGCYLNENDYNVWISSDYVKYKGFYNPKTGDKGCVITNTDAKTHEFSVDFLNNNDKSMILYTPFDERKNITANQKCYVPSEKMVVVVESN